MTEDTHMLYWSVGDKTMNMAVTLHKPIQTLDDGKLMFGEGSEQVTLSPQVEWCVIPLDAVQDHE